MNVRTRMAPSPTGEFHIGSLRTLLYSLAWARKKNGKFIIRIEDTDQSRLVPGAQERMLQDIRDYGLSWDEGPEVGGEYGPYIQSQRLAIYTQQIQQLIISGDAYYCFCTKEALDNLREEQRKAGRIPRYDRRCLSLTKEEVAKNLQNKKSYVIRQKLPDNTEVSFTDLVMGEIKINTKELDDTVLIKSDGYPTYHFAVVVDDHMMEISHVLRAVEWISSTPKHLLLYQAFGWGPPLFGHLPVILSPKGQGKMSKREGDVSARSFLDKGYLPEATLNFLMLLGWSPGNDREFFTLEEFIQEFELEDLNSSNPAFDEFKLIHFNQHYIKNLSDEELTFRLKDYIPNYVEQVHKLALRELAPLVKERMKVLSEINILAGFMFKEPELINEGWKPMAKEQLQAVLEILQSSEGPGWNVERLTEQFTKEIENNHWKTGDFFMNLRLAIAGQPITPPITECMVILGKEKVIERITKVTR